MNYMHRQAKSFAEDPTFRLEVELEISDHLQRTLLFIIHLPKAE